MSQEALRAEHYTKQSDGRWLLSDYRSVEDVVKLDSIRCALPLSEIYDKVSIS